MYLCVSACVCVLCGVPSCMWHFCVCVCRFVYVVCVRCVYVCVYLCVCVCVCVCVMFTLVGRKLTG